MVKSLAKLATGTVLGVGITLAALSWTGSTNLDATKENAEEFRKAAVAYIEQANELEKYAQGLSDKNGTLEDKITQLEDTIKDLESSANDKNTNLGQAKKQLEKANQEIEKANKAAEKHEADMGKILDSSIFEEITINK